MKGKHNILKFGGGEFQICEEVAPFLPVSASYNNNNKSLDITLQTNIGRI